jgi:hypothetical protein
LKEVKEIAGGFCIFTLDPAGHDGPFTIAIDAPQPKETRMLTGAPRRGRLPKR